MIMDEYDADLKLRLKNWAAECHPPSSARRRLLKAASWYNRLPLSQVEFSLPRPLSIQVTRSFSRELNSVQQIQDAVWFFQLTSSQVKY
jgi:hypothetical protein